MYHGASATAIADSVSRLFVGSVVACSARYSGGIIRNTSSVSWTKFSGTWAGPPDQGRCDGEEAGAGELPPTDSRREE
jgi:hypothetical protein